jgi:hypothetical protein
MVKMVITLILTSSHTKEKRKKIKYLRIRQTSGRHQPSRWLEGDLVCKEFTGEVQMTRRWCSGYALPEDEAEDGTKSKIEAAGSTQGGGMTLGRDSARPQ